jgi:N-acetylglucosaminyldiphosphoundecaprenol N-acetyl-beta-D-mannosaminyltransferase
MTSHSIGISGIPRAFRPLRVSLFGVDIDALTMAETVDRAFALADAPGTAQHVVLNASKVVQMAKDDNLRKIVAGCALVNPDGQSVVWASHILGQPLPERVAGIDLFSAIVARASKSGHRLYFLGASEEVLDTMIGRLRQQYPNLVIAGHHNGYWKNDDEVIAAVRKAQPHFLFLAIPSPRKEYWLSTHLEALAVPFVMGVGGTFDVMAGKIRRAPLWVQRLGCEWMYRVAQEPTRMWKRYLQGNSMFMMIIARDWWRIN